MSLHLLNFSRAARVPVILQSEVAECGLAALAMVAAFHGHRIDLPVLRQRFGMSLKGANLKQLIRYAEHLQMSARAVRLDLDALPHLKLPAVLHWNLNHFVVLVEIGRKHLLVHDPARGALRLSREEFSRQFTGVALELTPTAAFKPAVETVNLRLSQLWGQVRGLGRSLAQVVLLAFVIQCFAMLAPYFVQLALDQVMVASDRSLLTLLGLSFAALSLFKAGAELTRAWCLMYLGSALNLQLGANLLRHLFRLPLEFFQKRQIGDLQSRFNALNEVRQALTGGLVEGLIDGVMAIATLALMLLYDARLTAVALGAALVYGAVRAWLYQGLRQALLDSVVKRARAESQFLESLRAMLPIKTFGRESERHAAWLSLHAEAINADARNTRLQAGYQFVFSAINGLEQVLLVWLGTLAVLDGGLSAGMLMAFLGYRALFAQRAATLIDKWLEYRMLSVHLGRLADIALAEPEPHLDGAGVVAERVRGQLELRGVGFRYGEDEPWLFRDVNLVVRPGECLAFAGRSGQGKTTLLKIMMGLIAPTEGEVLLDGVDIRRMGLSHYRGLCAAVMQDDHLISGSLRDNISFQDAQADEARIQACAQAAAIADDIARMPMGLETLIGDMGAALSGGQQQRVVLARALYAKPRLLFLDEATSALDAATEAAVNRNVRALGITRVMVAHRQETLALADRVIDLGMWGKLPARAA